MNNTFFRTPPIALTTTTTTNIFNPGATSGGTNCTATPYDKLYVIVRKITVGNTTASSKTFALWFSTTGDNTAGKELPWAAGAASGAALTQGQTVPANGSVFSSDVLRFSPADFLVGGASASGLTIQLEGEIGVGT